MGSWEAIAFWQSGRRNWRRMNPRYARRGYKSSRTFVFNPESSNSSTLSNPRSSLFIFSSQPYHSQQTPRNTAKMKLISIAIAFFALHDLTATALPTNEPREPLEVSDMSYPDNPLQARRACWNGAHSGWSSERKRCWKRCGSPAEYQKGHWCWLAQDQGRGGWTFCEGDAGFCTGLCQLQAGQKSVGCGVGNCAECGCSC
jgi:hypothetical protein